jgi:hypothetical protein
MQSLKLIYVQMDDNRPASRFPILPIQSIGELKMRRRGVGLEVFPVLDTVGAPVSWDEDIGSPGAPEADCPACGLYTGPGEGFYLCRG